eukprot:TRINITY_DN9464_c0_g1_i17.p1 TRINITY_DN9464_c0_g1~~TRINITY_DN9464_c0_g1_i17.p1  ORF type:complete len:294 (+),score=23.62 TRINITY_DN9464_c0_g1_i17:93-974(+)
MAVGWIIGALLFLRLLYGIYRHFLRSGKNLVKNYGQWAVVTGSTDGIGKAFAFELARKKLNILLVARDQQKLEEVAKEIAEKHHVETKIAVLDFLNYDAKALQAAAKGLDIGLLINNVGMSYPFPQFFGELEAGLSDKLIKLNVESTTKVTELFLPTFVSAKRGAIVNISSAAALFPSPLLAVYSGTKAYVDRLTVSLHHEYQKKGVHFQLQSPLFVTSKLSKIRKPSLTVPSPNTYARVAVKCIGYDAEISPYWAHALQLYIMSWLPTSVVAFVALKMHLPLRSRALQKIKT